MVFSPGVSGNPAGRPRKGTSLRDLMRARPLKDKRALIDLAWQKALSGEFEWVRFVMEHSDGKPPASVELTGADGGPVTILSYGGGIEKE